ncbi:MAG: NADP-dependent malic enzyme [Clostridiales bacterium]|nr:NADP-dependent malic enzyme [Clostridiales bacterium]
MDNQQEALRLHKEWGGKIEVVSRVPVTNGQELALAYTPGVAAPCLAIQKDYNLSFDLTRRNNLVAVITDGTAVLGLGDIGPEAGMPVMEGKCALFKTFGGVDAFPLCVRSKDVDEIVRTIYLISGSFGGINLEDIAAPRCFEIEKRLQELCDIPIFHDDQHGTAIVAGAALINALKLVNKKLEDVSIVISGAGAAGVAIAKHLLAMGAGKNMFLVNRKGILYDGREDLAADQQELCKIINPQKKQGSLKDAMAGADVFLGVSGPGLVDGEMVKTMAKDAILFPMANPVPEIFPEDALNAGAKVVGTGRSDFPNQINNVLAFPGIFRGALDVRASRINTEMNLAASYAIAGLLRDEELTPDYIIPHAFDMRVGEAVAKAVSQAARDTGVARI